MKCRPRPIGATPVYTMCAQWSWHKLPAKNMILPYSVCMLLNLSIHTQEWNVHFPVNDSTFYIYIYKLAQAVAVPCTGLRVTAGLILNEIDFVKYDVLFVCLHADSCCCYRYVLHVLPFKVARQSPKQWPPLTIKIVWETAKNVNSAWEIGSTYVPNVLRNIELRLCS